MKVTPIAIALLSLFSETKPVAKLLKLMTESTAVEEQLRAIPVGERDTVEIPDELDIKFKTKGGLRFSIDAAAVKRLND